MEHTLQIKSNGETILEMFSLMSAYRMGRKGGGGFVYVQMWFVNVDSWFLKLGIYSTYSRDEVYFYTDKGTVTIYTLC